MGWAELAAVGAVSIVGDADALLGTVGDTALPCWFANGRVLDCGDEAGPDLRCDCCVVMMLASFFGFLSSSSILSSTSGLSS